MANDGDGGTAPDLDLLEYVVVSAPDVGALGPVADALVGLVDAGSIRLLDAVALEREATSTRVVPSDPADHAPLAVLTAALDGRVLLSAHDVALASVSLEADETALLLLVEDRWAGRLSEAARKGGARLVAGQRIARDRVSDAVDGRSTDLIVRGTPQIDQVAQVRELAHLVDRGLLPLERYDVQRRRVLGG